MTKLASLILILLFCISTSGQNTYLIDDFSSKYVGLIEIEKGFENNIFKKGTVSILNKTDSIKIITIKLDELTIDYIKKYDTKSAFLKVPYEKQNYF